MGKYYIEEFAGRLTVRYLADLVANTYDFNNHAYRRFIQELKVSTDGACVMVKHVELTRNQEKLDPNGILSPGRQGIWPKGYGGAGARAAGKL